MSDTAHGVRGRQLHNLAKSQDWVLRALARFMAGRGESPSSGSPGPMTRLAQAPGSFAVQLVTSARDVAAFQYRFTSEVLASIAPDDAGTNGSLAHITPLRVHARKF